VFNPCQAIAVNPFYPSTEVFIMMHRLFAPAIAAALTATMALPASAMDLTELTDAERAQFRAEVRAYLMAYPVLILEAVELLQSRDA